MKLNSKKLIAVNAISSGVQVLIVGLIYFFLYRILLEKLGVELLGIWSLVIATSSVATLANFGFSSGLVKFVSELNAKEEYEKINKFLFTAFFSLLLFFLIIVILILVLANIFVDNIVPLNYVELTLDLLPYSLISLVITSLGGVFTSALEGFQKNYVRNVAYIFTSIGYFVLAVILLPEFGLVGLAISQIAQAILIFLVSFYNLRKTYSGFEFFHWNWDKEIFRSLFHYGIKFQAISIFQMLYEPMTKILISRYSGISTLGFYEMASRFVNQFRAIISTMNQVTVPVIAHYMQMDKNAISLIYNRSMSFIVFLVFPIAGLIVLFTPHLSQIWIGNQEPIFINATYILSCSLIVNVLNAPAYFSSLGEGKLNGLLIMHLIIALLNIVLGVILGLLIPVYGVIIAWGLSVSAGSLYLIYYYHKKNSYNILNIYNKNDYRMILVGLIFIASSVFVLNKISIVFNFNLISFLLLLVIYISCFGPLIYSSGNLSFLTVFRQKKL